MQQHHFLIPEGASNGEIKLTESRYLLGRSPRCEIKLTSVISPRSVSRVHAFLVRIEGHYHIHDGDPDQDKPSMGGTWIWDREVEAWTRCKAAKLKHGDRLRFAPDVCYRYLRVDFDPSGESPSDSVGATWV